MIELIVILTLLYEIAIDNIEYKDKGMINHKRGVVIRIIITLLLIIVYPWTSVLLLIAVYLLVFDHAMGHIITGDMMHMGTEARWDRIIGKIPELPRLFLRIFIAVILASIHYLPIQWNTLFN